MWWEVITEALLDTLYLFPFLLLLYILIELMEHNTRMGKPSRLLSGKIAPLVGSATGLVPLCGFSVMAAKLYRHRHITLGALFAVFISTSDEAALVLLLSDLDWAAKFISLGALLGLKFALGVAVGYAIDLIMRRSGAAAPLPAPHEHVHDHEHEQEHDHDHDAHAHEHGEEDEAVHAEGNCDCSELSVCEHKKVSTLSLYLVSPLLHALEVAAFVLLVNLAFGFLFFGLGRGNAEAGEQLVGAFMHGAGYWWQPVVCAAVGMVPNCAASVVLAETYAIGGIGFGGLLGGLVANTGLGCLALFRGDVKRAVLICAALFLLGVAVGYAASAVCLVL